jgi:hypothetical protein
MSAISGWCEYKPYWYKRIGRIWFTTVYGLFFEEDVVYKDSDLENIKTITNLCNASYALGYSSGVIQAKLESERNEN